MQVRILTPLIVIGCLVLTWLPSVAAATPAVEITRLECQRSSDAQGNVGYTLTVGVVARELAEQTLTATVTLQHQDERRVRASSSCPEGFRDADGFVRVRWRVINDLAETTWDPMTKFLPQSFIDFSQSPPRVVVVVLTVHSGPAMGRKTLRVDLNSARPVPERLEPDSAERLPGDRNQSPDDLQPEPPAPPATSVFQLRPGHHRRAQVTSLLGAVEPGRSVQPFTAALEQLALDRVMVSFGANDLLQAMALVFRRPLPLQDAELLFPMRYRSQRLDSNTPPDGSEAPVTFHSMSDGLAYVCVAKRVASVVRLQPGQPLTMELFKDAVTYASRGLAGPGKGTVSDPPDKTGLPGLGDGRGAGFKVQRYITLNQVWLEIWADEAGTGYASVCCKISANGCNQQELYCQATVLPAGPVPGAGGPVQLSATDVVRFDQANWESFRVTMPIEQLIAVAAGASTVILAVDVNCAGLRAHRQLEWIVDPPPTGVSLPHLVDMDTLEVTPHLDDPNGAMLSARMSCTATALLGGKLNVGACLYSAPGVFVAASPGAPAAFRDPQGNYLVVQSFDIPFDDSTFENINLNLPCRHMALSRMQPHEVIVRVAASCGQWVTSYDIQCEVVLP